MEEEGEEEWDRPEPPLSCMHLEEPELVIGLVYLQSYLRYFDLRIRMV